MGALYDKIKSFITSPFSGGLDIENLFWITGLVLLFTAAWILILYHVRVAASEV